MHRSVFRSEPGPPAVRMGGVSESGMGFLAWRVVCATQAVAARWPAGVPAAAPRCTGREHSAINVTAPVTVPWNFKFNEAEVSSQPVRVPHCAPALQCARVGLPIAQVAAAAH